MSEETIVKIGKRRTILKSAEKPSSKPVREGVETFSIEGLNRQMSDFRLKIVQHLNVLAELFTTEFSNLEKVRQTISEEKKQIEQLFQIKVAASTLEELLKKQQKEQEEFQETMRQSKKGWQRQLEESEYKFELENRRTKDGLEDEKNSLRKKFQEQLEKEQKALEERKNLLVQQEKELTELRQKTAVFPAELQQAVQQAQEELRQQLQKEFVVSTQIKTQEYNNQKQISELKIGELEKQNQRQIQEIDLLKKQLQDATHQLKDIAVKVIEGKSEATKMIEIEKKEK